MVSSGVRLEAWEGGGVPPGPVLAGLERWGRPDMEETWRRRQARGGGWRGSGRRHVCASCRSPSPFPTSGGAGPSRDPGPELGPWRGRGSLC